MHATEVQSSMTLEPRTAPSPLTRTHAVIALAALSIFLLVARLPAYHEPVDWDVGTYSVIANELLHGERLYADVWDVKPPAIFVTYAFAQLIAGEGFLSVYLLSVIAAIVSTERVCSADSDRRRFITGRVDVTVNLVAVAVFAIVARRREHDHARVDESAHGATNRIVEIRINCRHAETQVDDANVVRRSIRRDPV